MTEVNTAASLQKLFNIPDELSNFVLVNPRMLNGERASDYFELLRMMIEEFEPTLYSEWLAMSDIAYILWDMRRGKNWKDALIDAHFRKSLESALREMHPASRVSGAQAAVRIEASEEANAWFRSRDERIKLENRLVNEGYDMDALNAGAFAEASKAVTSIERSINSARAQLSKSFREYRVRQEFERRVDRALDAAGPAASLPPAAG